MYKRQVGLDPFGYQPGGVFDQLRLLDVHLVDNQSAHGFQLAHHRAVEHRNKDFGERLPNLDSHLAAQGQHHRRNLLRKEMCIRDRVSVELLKLDVTTTSVSFRITPANAERVAWVCRPASEKALTAEELLAEGTQGRADAVSEAKAEGLQPETDYLVQAVAVAGDRTSEIALLKVCLLYTSPPGCYSSWSVLLRNRHRATRRIRMNSSSTPRIMQAMTVMKARS